MRTEADDGSSGVDDGALRANPLPPISTAIRDIDLEGGHVTLHF